MKTKKIIKQDLDQKRIAEIHEIMDEFIGRIKEIRRERDRRIEAILKKYETKKINDLMKDINKN